MCVPGCQEPCTARSRVAVSSRALPRAGFAASAVASAEAAPRQFKSVVDLTHTMSPEFPTFFGVPGIEMQKQFDFKKDGFNLNWWRIVEHAGTHLDAPLHFSETGATVEKIAAEALVVPLVVVNVASRAEENPDYQLSRQDLLDWEKKYRRLPNNCLRCDEFRLGAQRRQHGEIHRQGRGRRLPFSRAFRRSPPSG